MTRARDESLVRQAREELQLQIKEAAALIDRSPAFWSMMEGGFVPDHDRRRQVAAALHSTVEDLWPAEYAVGA